MTTHATIPSLAVPERPTEIRFTLSQSNTNFVRVWITSAPSGSELDGQLKDQSAGRLLFFQGSAERRNGARVASVQKVFDKGGHYTLIAQEYVLGAASYGGGYQSAPDSAPSETATGPETTRDLYIGQRVTSTIGAGADTGTLVLWVWNNTIQQTRLDFQGEASPAIIDARSPRASAAASSALVTAALTALAGQSVATAIDSIGSIVTGLRTATAAHMASASVHSTPDSTNGLSASHAGDPGTRLADFVNAALDSLRKHFGNEADPSAGPPFGYGSAAYHTRGDRAHLPLHQSVTETEAFAALADLWRAYEAHRVDTSLHSVGDTGNVLAPLPRLLAVHQRFLESLAATADTLVVPPGQTSGAMMLMQLAGFVEG